MTTVTLDPPQRRRGISWPRAVLLGILLIYLAPLALRAALLPYQNLPMRWDRADWSSIGALPPAAQSKPARILILSGRTGGWKGVFAVHTWIVLKGEGATRWSRYDVVGWGQPVRHDNWPPDGRWFGDRPIVVADLGGPQAAALIPKLEAAIATYAFNRRGDYRLWPGPNSNSFVAAALRAVPELQATLLPNAIGRDFRDAPYAGLTDSRTGIELNLYGVFVLKVGWVEGIEVNLFSLVAGLDLRHPALKIPGFGRIGLTTPARADGFAS